MLMNERAADLGFRAGLQLSKKGVVDVSLIPPGTQPRQQTLSPEAIFLS